MRIPIIIMSLVILSGCVSNDIPKAKPPELPIANMKLPEIVSTTPVAVPSKPRGQVFVFRQSGDSVTLRDRNAHMLEGDTKVMVFNADQIKQLNLIFNSAKGNEALVVELDKAQMLNLKYAENMKALAELEEARVARLEADLDYSETRLRQAEWEKNIETWTWKIVAILTLAVGL